MASGPHDPRSSWWSAESAADHGSTSHPSGPHQAHTPPPALHHSPPDPAESRSRGLPLDSPWALPPFGAPTPDEGARPPEEPPRQPSAGRHPYARPYGGAEPRHSAPPETPPHGESSPWEAPWDPEGGALSDHHSGEPYPREPYFGEPYAQEPYPDSDPDPDTDPSAPPRRLVNRPDRLVASGPPRVTSRPAPRVGDGPETSGEPGIRVGPTIPAEPESASEPPGVSGISVGERIGGPPEGRPARPDILVATGPPRPRGGGRGRHHRHQPSASPRPRAPRRRGPGRGLLTPIFVIVVLLGAAGLGLVIVNWINSPVSSGLRLAAGDGGSGDQAFVAPPGVSGNGSSQVLNAVTSVGSAVVAVGSDTTSPVPEAAVPGLVRRAARPGGWAR